MNEPKTLREALSSLCYPFMEKLVLKIEKVGYETELCGVQGFKTDTETFTAGAAFKMAVMMYLYHRKIDDQEMMEHDIHCMHITLDICFIRGIKTWGQLDLLRGLYKLQQIGKLDIIDPEYWNRLEVLSRYDYVYDSEKGCLKGSYPTNYLHVVAGMAGYRHALGWEDDRVMHQAAQEFLKTVDPSSSYGWMDESKGKQGRYDRYTLIVASEICETFDILGLEIPDYLKENLRKSAELTLFSANDRGDGIHYGRSLSTHGDGAQIDILVTAFLEGVLPESARDQAVLYMLAIVKKMRTFWIDPELGVFNISLNGRATNQYRSTHRLLQVNINMSSILLNSLERMEKAGLADYEPKGSFDLSFRFNKLTFEPDTRVLYTIMDHGKFISLPLIGAGDLFLHASYFPVPFLNRELEAPPEKFMPYLWPLVTYQDGTQALPIQYIRKISDNILEGSVKLADASQEEQVKIADENRIEKVKITCEFDRLVQAVPGPIPQQQERADSFTVKYEIQSGHIHVDFEFDFENWEDVQCVEFISTNEKIQAFGCASEILNTDDDLYDTPHGHRSYAVRYTAVPKQRNLKIGYEFTY